MQMLNVMLFVRAAAPFVLAGILMAVIFCRGVYLAENTSQAASVEFVRLRRTNYARSRLQILSKSP